MIKHILSALIILSGISLFAQPIFPDPGPLYDDGTVPRVDILIHPDSLFLIFEYPESDHEYPATFIFNNGSVHDTIEEIGFRLRGNTSRFAQKKSFKVSINSFHSGRKYYGVEKINLNGEHNDPSVIRSKLNWDIYRSFNVPAPRSNHVEVYINGDYYGLYISVEHIDEEFVLSRFNNNDGNLYKCLWPADLNYLGSDPDLYKMEYGDRRTYELKTNKEEDDYSDLAHFIDVLNNTPIADLPCELEKVFNVHDYLKVIAVQVTTGDWDAYIYNKNNFYLYRNTSTGRFEYIPYDTDNTFGIDWFGESWESRNMYTWSHPSELRPLYERILEVEKYRDQYTYYTNYLLENIVTEGGAFFQHIDILRDQAYDYIINDPFYPLDYGYDPVIFLQSYEQATGAHDKVGLKLFVIFRRTATMNQMDINNIFPVLNYAWHNNAVVGEEIWFRVFAEDDDDMSVMLNISEDGATAYNIEMHDDGQHNDYLAGDGFYGCSAGAFMAPVQLEVDFIATDIQSQESSYYCTPQLINIEVFEIPDLYVNEFMADNETSIADEWGDFDDWIEIYNAGDSPVWLGNLFLTDNLENENKWQMPDQTLEADSFLLIWADGEVSQGPLHANFKLSKDGEEIGLFGPESMGFPLIDSLTFGVQQEDVSMGRTKDAGLFWDFMEYATPGYSNESGFSVNEYSLLPILEIYPNPCRDGIVYLNQKERVFIFDMSGRLQMKAENTYKVDVHGLQPGVYLVMSENHRASRLIIQ